MGTGSQASFSVNNFHVRGQAKKEHPLPQFHGKGCEVTERTVSVVSRGRRERRTRAPRDDRTVNLFPDIPTATELRLAEEWGRQDDLREA